MFDPQNISIVALFFFNDTPTTEIYTLSLHDALPISAERHERPQRCGEGRRYGGSGRRCHRSEEHTSELQSRQYLVCRLLLEKKKKKHKCIYKKLQPRLTPTHSCARAPLASLCDIGLS